LQNRNFFEVRVRKCDLVVEFFSRFFVLMFRTKKEHLPQKKIEFFDKGQIKYGFLTRLKLKTPKHKNVNLEIEFLAVFLQTPL